jgi:hypothetical protein
LMLTEVAVAEVDPKRTNDNPVATMIVFMTSLPQS